MLVLKILVQVEFYKNLQRTRIGMIIFGQRNDYKSKLTSINTNQVNNS